MEETNELGHLLRKLRGKRSLREASEKSGISHTYLGVIEKGYDARSGNPVKPTPETLQSLSAAYGYPYEALMQAAGYLRESRAAYDAEEAGKAVQRLELAHLPERNNVTFRGRELTEEEKLKVVGMLDVMFGAGG